MKLAAKYNIEAPVDFVYRELVDFDAWERMALRRGAAVTRLASLTASGLTASGPGINWQVNFTFRAKDRSAGIRLLAATPDSHLTLSATSALVEGEILIDLLHLAASRTRIEVRVEVKPKTLAARIYMQTLRLARKKLDHSYAQRIAQLAVEMEDRYRRPAKP